MSNCIVCGNNNLQGLLNFDSYPFCIGVLPLRLKFKIQSFPLKISWCKDCNHVQQIDSVAEESKEVLYKNRYSDLLSSVPLPSKTGIGISEAERCYNFFKSCGLPKSRVMEIGCYDGYFLSLIKKDGYEVCGIEPNPMSRIAEKEYKIPIVRDFFSEKRFPPNSFDIIIMRNLLEHIENLNKFLSDISKVLSPDGYLLIEVPNISSILKEGSLGCFCHQHLSYFSLNVLLNLFRRYSFRQVHSSCDYTIFLCVQKVKNIPEEAYFEKNKDCRSEEVKRYSREYFQRKLDLEKILGKETRVAIFGAGGHATAMLRMIDREFIKKIKYVYDNSPLKHGKALFDLSVLVRHPKHISQDKPDSIIVSSYIYQETLSKQLEKMAIPRLKIINLYPEVNYYAQN